MELLTWMIHCHAAQYLDVLFYRYPLEITYNWLGFLQPLLIYLVTAQILQKVVDEYCLD